MQLLLLRFDRSHWYLYALLIIFFCEIRNPELYRAIVGYIPTPGLKVSAISCKYYYYGWIHITDFSCYLLLGFHAFIFTEKTEQHCLVIILNTGCERWTAGLSKGQDDCCKQDLFTVINRPVLLWLSFSSTVPIPYLNDKYSSSCGIYRSSIIDIL